jgi:hypothetical protein
MTDITPLRGDESGDLIVRIPVCFRSERVDPAIRREFFVTEVGDWELLGHTLPESMHDAVVRDAGNEELYGDSDLNTVIRDVAVYDEATETHTIPRPEPTPTSEAHRLRAGLEAVRDDLDGLWVNAGETTPVGEYLLALHARVTELLGAAPAA